MLQESVVDCSHFDRDFLMFKTFILAIGLTLTGSVAAITANWNGTLEMVVDGDDLCWQTSESGKLPSFAATPHLAPKATVVLGNGSVDWFCKDAYATMMNIRLKDTYYSFTLSGTTNATTGTVGLYTTGDYTQKGTLHGSEVTVGFGTPIELIFDYDKAEGTLSAYINGMLLANLANVESNDVLDWIGLGTFPGANDALFNGFAYADFDGGKVETAPGILPEPTALGLFVLGVAGVALRRRIA